MASTTVDSSVHSEEPWDQKGLVETAASAIRNWKPEDPEEQEIGELPSLATTTIRSSAKKEEASSEQMPYYRGGQKVWQDMETAAEALAKDHGPDDEMAARKAARRRRRLEAESQLTDEEEEEVEDDEEVYEQTFCGSTILGELCGTGGIMQPEPATIRVRSLSPRSVSSDQQQEQTAIEVEFVDKQTPETKGTPSDLETSGSRRLSNRARRAKEIKNRRATRKTSQDESQVTDPEKTPEDPTNQDTNEENPEEEQQQLEVELEPEQAPPPSPATQKKNARLAAIAKKARDNFQIRKGKPATIATEPVQAKSTRSRRSPSKKSVDEDYATFTATEKRIFIKLINSGMPATEATQRVIEDRGSEMMEKPVTTGSPTRRPFWKKDPPSATDPPGEASTLNEPEFSNPSSEQKELKMNEAIQGQGEMKENIDSEIISPLVSKLSSASPGQSKQPSDLKTTSSDDLFPFERTGLTYFDATRREKEEDPLYRDASGTTSSGRTTPKFFSVKSPGFSQLKESPDRRSNSAPPSRNKEPPTQKFSLDDCDMRDPIASGGGRDASLGSASVQGLVPRMAKRYQKVTENKKQTKVPEATARGLTLLRAPSGEETDGAEQVLSSSDKPDDSLDMDTYLNSTRESFVPTNSASDTASVYTMGTNVTGVTSYTTSTRTRRPGAAKSRLAKHKQHETEASKQLGWHQSIQAAAHSNNRKWDPEKGWVDYDEPQVVPETQSVRRDKIKVVLNKTNIRKGKSSSEDLGKETRGQPVAIPFPDEWANEREAMIRAKSSADSEKKKSNAWAESMKIASTQHAQEGSSLDKDCGWNNGNLERFSDSVDFGGKNRPLQLNTKTLKPVRGVARDEDPFASETDQNEQESTDDDNVALLDRRSNQGPKSPMVNVIKQKVSENEMSHFSPTFTNSNASGPVDVDELTTKMEAETVERKHETHGLVGVAAAANIGSSGLDEQSNGKSVAKMRSPSANIPRLNRSLRDTSPIAFRKKENEDSSTEDDILVEKTKKSPHEEGTLKTQQTGGRTSIKERMKTWETRIEAANSADGDENESGPRQVLTPGGTYNAAGWKTFLGKKVREEKESTGGERHTREKTSRVDHIVSALNISDISAIDAKSEDDAEYGSSAYGPSQSELRSTSLMKRLSECASPVMASTYKSKSIIPPALCGRQSADGEGSSIAERSSDEDQKRTLGSPNSKQVSSAYSVATSSVVSEDFGLKTAYLDAVAIKTAVSRSRRPTSRRRTRSSASSVASSASTDHSDKWKQLLEKRRSNGKISSSNSDISRATEKYASDKVSEIMQNISSRSKTVARSREVHREHQKRPQRPRTWVNPRADDGTSSEEDLMSTHAAEDLAAARVEAMMAALSADHGGEGEI